VAKFVARLLATAALGVRIQTSLKNHKWATQAQHTSPPKKYTKKIFALCEQIAKALVVCLESKDYVQIRNALIVLNEIITHFPLISVILLTNVADPGCLSRIPDPNFFHPGSRFKKILRFYYP
jgi:hypothetical protein